MIMKISKLNLLALLMMVFISACSTPATRPDNTPVTTAPEQPAAPSQPQGEVVPPQAVAPSAEPLPAPPSRTYTLSAATTALVNQAHAQVTANNLMMAASTIERALRIEPNNPLLWIEYSQVRMSEQNYYQAENLARKALMLANGDPHAQSLAWRALANSLRAQEKSDEAQQADARADALMPK